MNNTNERVACPTCGHIKPGPRHIPREHMEGLVDLLRGTYARVDAVDEAAAKKLFWRYDEDGYASRTIRVPGKGKRRSFLHRMIAERMLGRPLVAGEVVDHVDRDRLNNSRSNLRVTTASFNALNRGARLKSRTGFKGVEISKSGKRYLSHIRYNDKNYRLGGYSTPEEAAWMYDQWAIALHGEFVSTNFEYV